jgi:ribosomal protein S18 acetylase RimI-like enzyme
MLRHSPGVDRLESQLLLFESGEFADLFAGPEFTLYPRLFLECELAPRTEPEAQQPIPADLELASWNPHDYQAAAELIYTCYIGHTDAEINDQYRSLHGSLRFLHNIVRFPGCGVFEPNYSWLLRDRTTKAMAGMILCSRVASDVAHVTQLCVSPAYRGRGIGLGLLHRSAASLRQAGFEALTLTVTESNQKAVRLYQRFGFTQRQRFDAMVMRIQRGQR